MALNYRRMTEEEDKSRLLIETGEYKFIVDAIEQKRTKNGAHEMLVVDMLVTDSNNRDRKLRDWVVLMDEMDWKFRHFAKSCGLIDLYDAGTIEAKNFVGRQGVVKVGIKDCISKDNEPIKMNYVKDYLSTELAIKQNDSGFVDDDIPNFG